MAGLADEPWAVLLTGDRWSYLARQPTATRQVTADAADRDFAALRDLLGPKRAIDPEGPPFQGGVIGLACHEFAQRLEPSPMARDPDWPDLILARYDSLIAFDHAERRLWPIGPHARAWLKTETPDLALPDAPAEAMRGDDPRRYEDAVADVIGRIHAGEIFQANIARRWDGRLRPGTGPFDAFRRLMQRAPAAFAAYWRLPGLAVVSHSPETFLTLGADGEIEARPIKGTRPRAGDPYTDEILGRELLASPKDRAENLMIVDLMRNDLARVCRPGTVTVPTLFALESQSYVHHLVSTVRGRLAAGADAADVLAATFPPGSVTGAPKVQAMKVIAAHEPPRGPWCGSLFWAGVDGALASSVLIRTATLAKSAGRWRFRFDAGAGIVADSDPAAERAETETKIAALAWAFAGRNP
jgi:para-aminobenzoate synthetase component 1